MTAWKPRTICAHRLQQPVGHAGAGGRHGDRELGDADAGADVAEVDDAVRDETPCLVAARDDVPVGDVAVDDLARQAGENRCDDRRGLVERPRHPVVARAVANRAADAVEHELGVQGIPLVDAIGGRVLERRQRRGDVAGDRAVRA